MVVERRRKSRPAKTFEEELRLLIDELARLDFWSPIEGYVFLGAMLAKDYDHAADILREVADKRASSSRPGPERDKE